MALLEEQWSQANVFRVPSPGRAPRVRDGGAGRSALSRTPGRGVAPHAHLAYRACRVPGRGVDPRVYRPAASIR